MKGSYILIVELKNNSIISIGKKKKKNALTKDIIYTSAQH